MGHLDRFEGRTISGWSFDPATASSAKVAVSIGGTIIAEFAGTEFREDLARAGFGDGHCGFTWTLPADFDPLSSPPMIWFAETGEMLPGAESVAASIVLGTTDIFQAALSTGVWTLERIDWTPHGIEIQGWAVPPYGSPLDWILTHNGVPMKLTASSDRPDIAQRLRLLGPHHRFGFQARADGSVDRDGPHEFSFVDARTGKPYDPHHTLHVRSTDTPVPSEERRKRVSGLCALDDHHRAGATSFTRIDRVAREYFRSSFDEAEAILDWGCGCGRVLQFISREQRARVTGIDIDADNIAWCRDAFPESRFEVVEPQPPTPLPAGTYDFVFSISVLTHLDERAQFDWLAELRRVTKPGAKLFLSVHGELAWALSGLSLGRYAEWRSRGFLVAGKNSDLDGSDADTSGYYNSFTTRRYIFEHWSSYFKVLDVLAGAINNQQDLVVLERR
jgi:SAM-dependent methyltransferase